MNVSYNVALRKYTGVVSMIFIHVYFFQIQNELMRKLNLLGSCFVIDVIQKMTLLKKYCQMKASMGIPLLD